MAKKGRPESENKASNQLRIRMNDEEWKELDETCELTGLNKTQVVKKGIKLVNKEYKK